MHESSKRILIRRRIREVITVKQDATTVFICDNCQSENSIASPGNLSISEPTIETEALGANRTKTDMKLRKYK